MVTPIVGGGTEEVRWREWPGVRKWADLDLASPKPPLVVAPHPDDEILGVGGMLAVLGAAEIVAVTDGEASHPDSTVYTPAELAAIRRVETDRALRYLGLGKAQVHRLGQPDGGVDEDELTAFLIAHLTLDQWCLATWRGDGHPDHEAVGRAAASACAATGAVLLEYPIWMWHWAEPDDERVPWDRAHRVDLTGPAQQAKASAIAEFTSQITALGPEPGDAPILPEHILARFARPFEVVFR